MHVALIYFLLAAVLLVLGFAAALANALGVTALAVTFGVFLVSMGVFVGRSYTGLTELLQAQHAVTKGEGARAKGILDGTRLPSAGAQAWAHWIYGIAALYGDDDPQARLHLQHVAKFCRSSVASFYAYRDRLLASAAVGEALADARLFQRAQDPTQLEACRQSIAYAATLCAPYPVLQAQVLAASAIASVESARAGELQRLGPYVRFLDPPLRTWVRALQRPMEATYRTAAARGSDTTKTTAGAAASLGSARSHRAGSYDAKAAHQPAMQLVLFVIAIGLLTFAGLSQLKNVNEVARNIPLGVASGLLASLVLVIKVQRDDLRNAALPNLAPRATLGDAGALLALEKEAKHMNTAVAVNACAHSAAVYASLARYNDVLHWVDLGLGRIKATPNLDAMFRLQLYPNLLALRAEALACSGRADDACAEVERLQKEFAEHPAAKGAAEITPILLAAHAGDDAVLERILPSEPRAQNYALEQLLEGWTIALSSPLDSQRAALFLTALASDPITKRWLEVASPTLQGRLQEVAQPGVS